MTGRRMVFMDGLARESISSLFGTISLISSLCLLLPQLVKNYQTKSANALSRLFLLVWLTGDVASLAGGIVTSIAPSAIVLSAYLCVSDSLLISQCWYYTVVKKPKALSQQGAVEEPQESHQDEGENDRLIHPRHYPEAQDHESSDVDSVQTANAQTKHSWGFNVLFILGVYLTGIFVWLVFHNPTAPDLPGGEQADTDTSTVGVSLGYLSAICYLGAPIPQIIKNARKQSTEGLAPLFFLLSLTNNLTYGLSVLSYSQEPRYLVKSIPWLLGSLGAMIEDCTIFLQFLWYS